MDRSTPLSYDDQLKEDRQRLLRARWRFTLLPLKGLAGLLALSLPVALLGWSQYSNIVPLFLFFGAIVVLFAGAWYDFGAKGYVRDLIHTHQPITGEDLDRIHREQFILTLCYGGVAGLYILIALGIALA
ncbi:MAG: hypothetical protein L3K03_06710 [Thermoplasmata archaeon]|nr:hypothetical protein [Thermoplasmata archaeon]